MKKACSPAGGDGAPRPGNSISMAPPAALCRKAPSIRLLPLPLLPRKRTLPEPAQIAMARFAAAAALSGLVVLLVAGGPAKWLLNHAIVCAPRGAAAEANAARAASATSRDPPPRHRAPLRAGAAMAQSPPDACNQVLGACAGDLSKALSGLGISSPAELGQVRQTGASEGAA